MVKSIACGRCFLQRSGRREGRCRCRCIREGVYGLHVC